MTSDAAFPEFLTLQEIVQAAHARLDRGDWDYLVGAAETETTMKRNRRAFERLALKARIMNVVAQVDTRSSLLGAELRIPVVLAPIGSLQVFHPDGGLAAARAAGEFGVLQIHSSVCKPDFEALAQVCDAPKIYQLYVHGTEDWVMSVIGSAQAAGYLGFCLTADTQVYSRRERDVLKRYQPASTRRSDGRSANRPKVTLQHSMTWDMVDRIRSQFSIPLVIKGVACAEDAEAAVQHGIAVIYVSNHGGRQLDHGRASLDTLAEVVAAVKGRAKVVFDGGVLRGTDVIKALALGADVVGIGRLQALAMAAGGQAAVVRMLELLELEIRTNLALMGLSSIRQLNPGCVLPAEPVGESHVLSGFPLLDQYRAT